MILVARFKLRSAYREWTDGRSQPLMSEALVQLSLISSWCDCQSSHTRRWMKMWWCFQWWLCRRAPKGFCWHETDVSRYCGYGAMKRIYWGTARLLSLARYWHTLVSWSSYWGMYSHLLLFCQVFFLYLIKLPLKCHHPTQAFSEVTLKSSGPHTRSLKMSISSCKDEHMWPNDVISLCHGNGCRKENIQCVTN